MHLTINGSILKSLCFSNLSEFFQKSRLQMQLQSAKFQQEKIKKIQKQMVLTQPEVSTYNICNVFLYMLNFVLSLKKQQSKFYSTTVQQLTLVLGRHFQVPVPLRIGLRCQNHLQNSNFVPNKSYLEAMGQNIAKYL